MVSVHALSSARQDYHPRGRTAASIRQTPDWRSQSIHSKQEPQEQAGPTARIPALPRGHRLTERPTRQGDVHGRSRFEQGQARGEGPILLTLVAVTGHDKGHLGVEADEFDHLLLKPASEEAVVALLNALPLESRL